MRVLGVLHACARGTACVCEGYCMRVRGVLLAC